MENSEGNVVSNIKTEVVASKNEPDVDLSVVDMDTDTDTVYGGGDSDREEDPSKNDDVEIPATSPGSNVRSPKPSLAERLSNMQFIVPSSTTTASSSGYDLMTFCGSGTGDTSTKNLADTTNACVPLDRMTLSAKPLLPPPLDMDTTEEVAGTVTDRPLDTRWRNVATSPLPLPPIDANVVTTCSKCAQQRDDVASKVVAPKKNLTKDKGINTDEQIQELPLEVAARPPHDCNKSHCFPDDREFHRAWLDVTTSLQTVKGNVDSLVDVGWLEVAATATATHKDQDCDKLRLTTTAVLRSMQDFTIALRTLLNAHYRLD